MAVSLPKIANFAKQNFNRSEIFRLTTLQTDRAAALPSLTQCQRRLGNDHEVGPLSPREDNGSLTRKFRKSYIDEKYGVDEAKKKYAEWDKLMQQRFVRRKWAQSIPG